MFCTKCGKPLAEGAKFCTACGAPPGQEPAPQPTPAPAPQPASEPRASVPVSPVPARRGPGGGMIALIAAIAVLAAAAIGLLVFLLLGKDDVPPALQTADPGISADAPTDLPIDAAYDVSIMDGTYYCAQEAGSTLELYSAEGQLSIYKTYYGSADVSTLIEAPAGPNFTINYGGRIIEFYYSASGQSVTVTEGGYSSIFTTDGDRNWVIDATISDPFQDPNGYILPTDTQYITESDLYPFSEEEVKLIRNEIYARHGYSFTMEKFRDYFNGKNWYFENPSVNVNTFGTDQMNDYERANVDVIKAYEEKMGW